ncbi:MAG: hypothetical protein R3F12_00015 [Lysobacteraceae bacterium]
MREYFSSLLGDWDNFLSFSHQVGARYSFDGNEALLPTAAEIFENRTGSHLLVFDVDGVAVNCHFFTSDEIELDIDPREISSEAQHVSVLEFVSDLVAAVRKDATITPENSPDDPFLRLSAATRTWVIT